MAAVLFRGEGALISYQSAAWLWGLEKKLEIPVNVSVRWRGHAQDGIGLHHCPALRDEDVAATERLPVTAVPRTLLDYASTAKRYGSNSRSITPNDSDSSTRRPSTGSPTRSGATRPRPLAGVDDLPREEASRGPAARSGCWPRSPMPVCRDRR